MAILFMQNELSGTVTDPNYYFTSSDVRAQVDTNVDAFDPEAQRRATPRPNYNFSPFQVSPPPGDTKKYWVHFRFNQRNDTSRYVKLQIGEHPSSPSSNTNTVITVGYSDGRIQCQAAGEYCYETGKYDKAAQTEIDLHVDSNTGYFEVYCNGALIKAGTSNSAKSSYKMLYVWIDGGSTIPISELIITEDEPTLGMRLLTLTPDALASGKMSGDISDITEIGLDEAAMETEVAGANLFSLTDVHNTFASNSDLIIRAIDVKALVSKSAASELEYAQMTIKTDGEVHKELAPKQITATSPGRALSAFHEVNPKTGKAWTVAEVNTLEAGVEFAGTVADVDFIPHITFTTANSNNNYQGYRKDSTTLNNLISGGTWYDENGIPGGFIESVEWQNNHGRGIFKTNDGRKWAHGPNGVRLHFRETDGNIQTEQIPWNNTAKDYRRDGGYFYSWLKDRAGQVLEVMIEGY
ncbi:hypothetical protein CZP2022_67 [Vibrio phage C-ZP2022]|nr:hypothetical protein CZP2022_67 [Vibrio phage C-ZP2022]